MEWSYKFYLTIFPSVVVNEVDLTEGPEHVFAVVDAINAKNVAIIVIFEYILLG